MFKEANSKNYSDISYSEPINGTDNEFILRMDFISALAASGATNEEITNAKSQGKDKAFIEINLEQVKMMQFQNSANNKYTTTLSQSTIAGGSLGNQTCAGRLVLRDGRENTFEFIKKAVFDKYKVFKQSVGNGVGAGFGADGGGADIFGPGFNDVLETTQVDDANDLFNTYANNQLAHIDIHQLPDFDLIVLSKKNDGSIKAKQVVKNAKFSSLGQASSVDSLEANSIIQFRASKATGWIPLSMEVN